MTVLLSRRGAFAAESRYILRKNKNERQEKLYPDKVKGLLIKSSQKSVVPAYSRRHILQYQKVTKG